MRKQEVRETERVNLLPRDLQCRVRRPGQDQLHHTTDYNTNNYIVTTLPITKHYVHLISIIRTLPTSYPMT